MTDETTDGSASPRDPSDDTIGNKTEIKRLAELYSILKRRTIELRSPITSLLLHTENMKALDAKSRDCILRICEVINEKNDELIFSEQLLKEVILQLAPFADIRES